MELLSAKPMDLPVIGAQPPERADAVRNRERILEAAARLFAERGADCTSIDDIAAAAGVGKGTIFRRFGDRSTLALAVLDGSEQALQDGFLRGPPPLGPGAPPMERLIAFGAAMYDNLELNGDVLLDAETSGAGSYMRSAPRAVHWLHVRTLVREARPDCDPDFLADILLGPLAPHVFAHQRGPREMGLDQLKAGYADLVTRLLG